MGQGYQVRVNIVLGKYDNQQRIMPRKARVLADATGWSIARQADPSADLNYFFPYLERKGPVEGITAAYFTHREDKRRQAKADHWDRVARAVNLRLTSSQHNLPYLEPFGRTVRVIPPLDREKFCIVERPAHGRPVVGTSGYVYPGARKGEDLIAYLRESKTGRGCTWTASGRGWPIPTRGWLWEEMQQFYQGLDVYVCASRIEGVGYGPLEALACGVPVVIPWHVGMFDELGDSPGIVRYRTGDAVDLERALGEALEVKAEPEELRSHTEMFTAERWVADHVQAFAELMQPSSTEARTAEAEPVRVLPDWRGHSGVYLVAFGEPSRRCARKCIEALKRHNPSLPVMLASDKALDAGEDMLSRQAEVDVGARAAKLNVYEATPAEWEYVLYLDADTEPQGPLDSIFAWLADGYEWVQCKNPQRFAVAQHMVRPDNHAECEAVFKLWGSDQMMQWNGGLFGFRRCQRVREFMSLWHQEWQQTGGRDQPPLLRALWQYPLRALWLTNLWNLDPKYYDPQMVSRAAVLHYPQTGRRWSGLIHGRTDSPEAWAKVRDWEAGRMSR